MYADEIVYYMIIYLNIKNAITLILLYVRLDIFKPKLRRCDTSVYPCAYTYTYYNSTYVQVVLFIRIARVLCH